MVAVGNRVLLRRGDYAFFPHVTWAFSLPPDWKRMLMGSSIHCAHGDGLLAFALFLHGIKEDRFCPGRKCFVRIGDFSAKIVCPKGR